MAIFLVRHGATRLSGTYCGSSNPPLTPQGRDQIQSAAPFLARFPIDLCCSSPLLRAEQSAAIINYSLKAPMRTFQELRELDFGVWEGLKFEEVEQKWPALAKRWTKDPIAVRIPRAETFASLRRRVKRFLASLKGRYLEHNVAIVAHAGSLSAIVLELLGLPDKELPNHMQPLGSIRMLRGRTLTSIHPLC